MVHTLSIDVRPKLTRACKACIKSKRRCSFELPKCIRCQDRNLVCDYENEPLTQQASSTMKKQQVERRNLLIETTSRKDTVSSTSPRMISALLHMDEPLCKIAVDERTLSFLSNHLRKHIITFGLFGSTTFIHPNTQASSLLTHVRSLTYGLTTSEAFIKTGYLQEVTMDNLTLLNDTFTNLVSSLPTLHSYSTLLPFTQSLVLIQIITLFIIPPQLLPSWILKTTEARDQLLKRVTRKLWESAPGYLSANLSRHEAYAMAESIRRTILVSHELQSQYNVYKHGWFEYELFVASLPFDRRFRLWEAQSWEFDSVIDEMQKDNELQNMVSYAEFVTMFDRMEVKTMESPFETMLLVGAKGLDSVEERYGLRLT